MSDRSHGTTLIGGKGTDAIPNDAVPHYRPEEVMSLLKEHQAQIHQILMFSNTRMEHLHAEALALQVVIDETRRACENLEMQLAQFGKTITPEVKATW